MYFVKYSFYNHFENENTRDVIICYFVHETLSNSTKMYCSLHVHVHISNMNNRAVVMSFFHSFGIQNNLKIRKG